MRSALKCIFIILVQVLTIINETRENQANKSKFEHSSRTSPNIVFLGGLAGLPALSIDIGLPALVKMRADLHATATEAGSTLSLFIVGLAIAPLVCGPLSDRFGRRTVLVGGLGLFTLFGLLSALGTDINQLLIFRLFQGCGAGAASIMPVAIVRDSFRGATAKRMLAHMALVRGVSPAIAPMLGAALLVIGNWRTINLALMIAGLVLLIFALCGFNETRDGTPMATHPSALGKNYAIVLFNPVVLCNALIQAFALATMFAWVSASPLVIIGILHISTAGFSIIFALTSASIMFGSFSCAKLTSRGVNLDAVLGSTTAAVWIAALILTIASVYGYTSLVLLLPMLIIVNFGFGLIVPLALHGMMEPLPEMSGYVAGLGNASQMMAAAFASWLVSYASDGRSMLSMAGVMLGCATAMALSCYVTSNLSDASR